MGPPIFKDFERKILATLLTLTMVLSGPRPAQAAMTRLASFDLPIAGDNLSSYQTMNTMFYSQGFIYSTSVNGLVKIDANNFNVAGTIPVSKVESPVAAVVDEANGYGYFLYSFGTVLKINLATFLQEGSLVLTTANGTGAAIDTAGGFAYFSSFTGAQATICKVRLSDFKEVAKIKTVAGSQSFTIQVDSAQNFLYVVLSQVAAGTRIERINLTTFSFDTFLQLPGAGGTLTSKIDLTGGMLYLVNTLGVIKRIRLSDFTANGSLNVGAATGVVIDPVAGFIYLSNNVFGQGKIFKVRLSDLSLINTLTLSTTTQDYLQLAAIDVAGGNAFFGTSTPLNERSTLTRVRLSNFTEAAVGKLPLAPGLVKAGVVDKANNQIFYVSQTTDANATYLSLFKVGIAGFVFQGLATLPNDATWGASVFDLAGGFAYIAYSRGVATGTGTGPNVAKIIKVRMSDFQVMNTITLPADEVMIGKALIDVAGGFAYFCSDAAFGPGGKISRIRLSDFTRVDTLTVATQASFTSAVLDKANGFAYFSYGGATPGTVRVGLSDFQVKATFPYRPSGNGQLDAARGVIYFPNTIASKRVIQKINTSNFTVSGSVELSGINQIISTHYEPSSDSIYVGGFRSLSTSGQVLRVNAANMTVADTLTLAADEVKPITLLVDAAGQAGYATIGEAPSPTIPDPITRVIKFSVDNSGPPPTNVAPAPNAGLDKTITLPASANLQGGVSDDGLPNPPATVTTTWSKVSGPGTVSFDNANALAATASFSKSGTYVLRLTASDSALNAADDVTIIVKPVANQVPTSNAGLNQTITFPASANLSGIASDDGFPNPPATLTTVWTKVSGPGTVAFGNASSLSTTATFGAAGTYVLRLTVSDSELNDTDDMKINVELLTDPSANQPPNANAGLNKTVVLPSGVTLAGSATDDGLPNPPGSVTVTWTKESGPGSVVFGNSASAATTATFTLPGIYVLQLTASDSLLDDSDEVTITVNAPTNQAPTVSAGSSQTVVLPASGHLLGMMSDDGLPNPPAALSMIWSQVSGPGIADFTNPTALSTLVNFVTPGVYVLRLTASDSQLTSSGDVTITATLPVSTPTGNDGGSAAGKNVFNPQRGESAFIPCDGGNVDIYTTHGNRLTSLSCVNGTATWNGSGAAAGMYLAISGSKKSKVILVK